MAKCICTHDENEHGDTYCMGAFTICDCHGFNPGKATGELEAEPEKEPVEA